MMNKTRILKILFALLIISAWGCDKGDDLAANTDVATVQSSLQVDRWNVTYFFDEGVDRTTDFSGFLIAFNSNGSISAVNNLFTVSGNWSVAKDGNFSEVNITFPSPASFQRLTKDWRVNTNTLSRVSMQKVKADGTSAFLTIEK